VYNLYIKLLSNIIVRLFVITKYNSLTNKVKCIGAAAEALVGGVKIVFKRESSNYSIVIGGVIKHKISKFF
jgi:hypothetical protein